MSSEINQVLAQMRVMSAKAQGVPAAEEGAQGGFGELLTKSINAVNDSQKHAGELKQAFEVGEPGLDLAEVMIAVQKSSVSFQAMVEVRNKLVDAYKDVMNMPV